MHVPNLRVSLTEKGISRVFYFYREIGVHPIRAWYPTKIRSGVGCTPGTRLFEKSGRVAPDTHPPDLDFTRVQGPGPERRFYPWWL
jgi:hypothetical protein